MYPKILKVFKVTPNFLGNVFLENVLEKMKGFLKPTFGFLGQSWNFLMLNFGKKLFCLRFTPGVALSQVL